LIWPSHKINESGSHVPVPPGKKNKTLITMNGSSSAQTQFSKSGGKHKTTAPGFHVITITLY